MTDNSAQIFRGLPSVSKCLSSGIGVKLEELYGLGVTTFTLRQVLQLAREKIRDGESRESSFEKLLKQWEDATHRLCLPIGRRTINATGILLHTGLGRAPLSALAVAALSEFSGYTLLEVDLESGERGRREARLESILRELTGCEAATVVNNNAAATSLVLRAIAREKEVVISRGQLIEIGGAFRMPDVMRESGCFLREVGTTNRTHLSDYEAAMNERTGALLHVHCSNYRIHGFAGTPTIRELCDLGKRYSLPVIDDLGSGALVRLSEFGLSDEHLVRDSLSAGAQLVCFSGDKLICGPQAGIICGKKEAVARARKEPFFRMFRPDKLTLAALESTLLHFLNGDYKENIPLYKMLSLNEDELRHRATLLASSLESTSLTGTIRSDTAYTGGGALPDEGIPSVVLEVQGQGKEWACARARALRHYLPSVFCRMSDGLLVFDMRTLLSRDIDDLCVILPKVLTSED